MQFTRLGQGPSKTPLIAPQIVKTMKLLTVFLTVFLIQLSAKTSAQQVNYSIKQGKLKDAFASLEKQTGMNFFYSSEDIAKAKQVSVDIKNLPIDKAVEALLKDQPLEYSIKGNTIFIKTKKPVTAQATETVQAFTPPPIDVKGRVMDSTGTPLSGASIKVKGTNISTATDDNGEYTLNGISNDAVLVIGFIGYGTKEVKVNNQTQIGVILKVTNKELAEVAIQSYSSGYQQIPKERATGSFAFVDNTLLNRKVSTNILDRLEGVVPGILFNHNASENSISIRGRSTLFANASPLIVVDNFPYDGDLSNINPNDVLSITVLKDAASASIWGVQSGNGVIVITTKRGKRNQPMMIEANLNTSISQKQDIYYNRSFLQSSDFISVEQNLFSQGFYDAQLLDSKRPPVSPVVATLAKLRSGAINQATADNLINSYKTIDIRNDLSDYFYQQAITQQYAVNVRGGGEKNAYMFSVGYDKNKTGLVGNNNDRITLKGNSDFFLTKNLTFSAGITYTSTNAANNSPVGSMGTGGSYGTAVYPYAQLVGSQGQALSIVKDYHSDWSSNPVNGRLDWQYRPLDELRYANNTSHLLDNLLNFSVKYNLPLGFKVSALYQYEVSKANSEKYYSDQTYYNRNLVNSYAKVNGSSFTFPIPIGGILQQSQASLSSNRLRTQLEYAHTFKSDHTLSGIAGAEVNEAITSSVNPATVYGYNRDNNSFQIVDFTTYFPLRPVGNTSRIPNNIGFNKFTNRNISYFGNLGYTYKGRYTATFSGRVDKSNLFGVKANQQSVPLYSAGLGWVLTKESFIHEKWLQYLNVRATYGYNGNLDKSATAITTFDVLSNNQFFGLPYGSIASPGNPLLKWERTRVINLGVDYSILNNFLSGSFDYYIKHGFDLFSNAPLPASSGWSNFYGNNADIKGSGYDITLNLDFIRTKNFSWTTNIIASYSLDKVSNYRANTNITSLLLAGASSGSIAPQNDRPVFSIYAYRMAGLSHDKGDPQGYLGGKISTDYANIIKAATIDSLHFIGSARPLNYGSIRNTITYNGISLSFNIIYKYNYYFRKSSISYTSLFRSWIGNSDFSRRWQNPGDETQTNVPSMPSSISSLNANRETFYGNSDALVLKGDHIRLQDISLSYALPLPAATRRVIKGINLYAYLNNVGILWRANNEKLDPDVFSTGAPNPLSVSFGTKINF
jgi:TonB-linked SusC/RagA family outer membrane protein